MCVYVAMTVAPQLAMHQHFCAYNVRASCDDGRIAACDALTRLRLQYACMLRSRRSLRCINGCALALCGHVAMTVAPELALH